MKIKVGILFFSFFISVSSPFIAWAVTVETIPVEGEPLALAVDEGSGRLFSLNFFNKSLSVIDANKLKVIKTLALEKRINRNLGSSAILYDLSRDTLFVTTGGGDVLVFNTSTYELKYNLKIARFIPDLASDGHYLYLLDWSGVIHKYEGSELHSLIDHGEKGSPYMHFGKEGRIYLSSGGRGLFAIDALSGEFVKKLDIDAYSTAASSGERVFVAGPGKLYVISSLALEVEKSISINYGQIGGLGLVYNPANGLVYVVTEENTVTLVDPRGAGSIVEKIDVCEGPKALAVNNKTGTVYVACPAGKAIAVLKE